jgi:AcrR family transcriptional regulator
MTIETDDPRITRTGDRYEQRRSAIIATATALLNANGVRGMRMCDVAAARGLTSTSVTYYYRRKEDLVVACLETGLATLGEMIEEAGQVADPPGRVSRLVEVFLQAHQRIQAREQAPLCVFSDIRALKEPYGAPMRAAFSAMVEQAAGLFDGPGYEWMGELGRWARARMLIEQLLWAVAWLPKYAEDDLSRVHRCMVDILLGGLAAGDKAWPPKDAGVLPPPMDPDAAGHEMFLGVATRLINSRGCRGASIDDITAALNLTKGAFYHRNETKDDLVLACFERSYHHVRNLQRRARDLPGSEWDRLSSTVVALIKHQVSAEGPLLRSAAMSAAPNEPRRQMIKRSHRITDHFAAMISDGVADGSIRPVDPSIAAQMLLPMLDTASYSSQEDPDPRHRLIDERDAVGLRAKPLMIGLFNR